MCPRSVLGGKRRNLKDCFHALFLSRAWQYQVGRIRLGKRVSKEGGEEDQMRRVGGSALVCGVCGGKGLAAGRE